MEKNKQGVELHCHSVYSEQDGVILIESTYKLLYDIY